MFKAHTQIECSIKYVPLLMRKVTYTKIGT